MRLEWEVAVRSFRRHATYRAATVAGVVTNTVFAIVQASVLRAVYRARDVVGGLDETEAVTFVFTTQGLLAAVAVFGWHEIAERVRSGEIVVDLLRPGDFQRWWLAFDLGRAAYQLVFRGVPPFLAGMATFGAVAPTDPAVVAGFLAAVLLAVVVSFAIHYLVNLAAFWVLDVRGPAQLVMTVWLFLSGFLLPVTFFPGWLQAVARATPFPAVVQLPVEVLLGQHRGLALAGVLAVQAAWAVALLGAGRVVFAAATRRLVVQGG